MRFRIAINSRVCDFSKCVACCCSIRQCSERCMIILMRLREVLCVSMCATSQSRNNANYLFKLCCNLLPNLQKKNHDTSRSFTISKLLCARKTYFVLCLVKTIFYFFKLIIFLRSFNCGTKQFIHFQN